MDCHALAFQKIFDQFLEQGCATYQDKLISVTDWLTVIKLFSQFIRKALAGSVNGKGWAFS